MTVGRALYNLRVIIIYISGLMCFLLNYELVNASSLADTQRPRRVQPTESLPSSQVQDDGTGSFPLNAWKTTKYYDNRPSNRQKHSANLVRAPKDSRSFMLVFGGETFSKTSGRRLLNRECAMLVNGSDDEAALCCKGTSSAETWLYSLTETIWLQITDTLSSGPAPRYEHSAATLWNKEGILVYGGRDITYSGGTGDFESSNVFNDVWILILASTVSRYNFGTWIKVNISNACSSDVALISYDKSPCRRFQASVESLNSSTFVLFGGCSGDQYECGTRHNDLWLLRVQVDNFTARGTWQKIDISSSTLVPTVRSLASLSYTGDTRASIIVFSGRNDFGILDDMYEFKFEVMAGSIAAAGKWKKLPSFNTSFLSVPNLESLYHAHFDNTSQCLLTIRLQPKAPSTIPVLFTFCLTSEISNTSVTSHEDFGVWSSVTPWRQSVSLPRAFPITITSQSVVFNSMEQILVFGGVVDIFTGLESNNLWSLQLGAAVSGAQNEECSKYATCAYDGLISSLRTRGWVFGAVRNSNPELRTLHASVTVENIMYIIGGQPLTAAQNTSISFSTEDFLLRNFLWSFEPNDHFWIPVSIDILPHVTGVDAIVSNASFVIGLSGVSFDISDNLALVEKYSSTHLAISFGGFTRSDANDCTQGELQNGVAVFAASSRSIWSVTYFHRGNCSEVNSRTWPSARRDHSAVAYQGSMYVFGGISGFPGNSSCSGSNSVVVLDELWYLNVSSLRWTKIERGDGLWPQARFAHTASVANGVMYIFGGATVQHVLPKSETFWTFSFEQRKWRLLSLPAAPTPRFFHSAASISDGKFAITGGCVRDVEIYRSKLGCVYCSSRLILNNSTWIFTADAAGGGSWFQTKGNVATEETTGVIGAARSMHSLASLKQSSGADVLVLFGGFSKCLSDAAVDTTLILHPGCNVGFRSPNFSSTDCQPCEKGMYKDSIQSAKCTPCPQHTTTNDIGNTHIQACEVCVANFCYGNGVCTASSTDGSPTARCVQCNFGYIESQRCSQPVYYYAIFGSIIGIVVAVATIRLLLNLRRNAKGRIEHERLLRTSRRELSEMNDAWKIDSAEIILKNRIDSESPGGFGEVWLAEYRDMKVAVKTISSMQLMLNPSALQDMQQEMMLMRTLRHPNIVLFLGGGELQEDQGAFIVMEYMSRGTLTDVLRDQTVHMDREQQLRFALDISKGMRFIHSLTPPRLHRDLKSANCLVSEKWIAKIADFGASRLLHAADMKNSSRMSFQKGEDEDESFVELNIAGESARQITLQSPLLGIRQWDLTTQIGTLLWRAPELWRSEAYGTPSDVYSFGIVLWEILVREQPFHDKKFRNKFEIQDMVLAGTRPTIPNNCPQQYRDMMTSCWSDQPDDRPPFDDIVRSLDKQLETARFPVMSSGVGESFAEDSGTRKRGSTRYSRFEW